MDDSKTDQPIVPQSLDEKMELVGMKKFKLGTSTQRDGFKATNNPLFVWEAIRICYKEHTPLPQWVMEYLHEVAEKLCTKDETKKGNDLAPVIARAFGLLPERQNIFSMYETEKRDLEDFIQSAYATGEGAKAEDVYKDIAEKTESRTSKNVRMQVDRMAKKIIK